MSDGEAWGPGLFDSRACGLSWLLAHFAVIQEAVCTTTPLTMTQMCCGEDGVGGWDLCEVKVSKLVELKQSDSWDFPGGPVVKTSPSNVGGVGSVPGQRAKIPHASWPKNQNIKHKQYCECMHAQSLQSCPTLCNPMDCSQTSSTVHGILQARILEWVAIPFSRGSS